MMIVDTSLVHCVRIKEEELIICSPKRNSGLQARKEEAICSNTFIGEYFILKSDCELSTGFLQLRRRRRPQTLMTPINTDNLNSFAHDDNLPVQTFSHRGEFFWIQKHLLGQSSFRSTGLHSLVEFVTSP
uniref:Uncharacterized protein n=1 Tax=Cacopsylla melanoneura TaxID=428564 RepID=A0A8D9A5I4_9HEMI